MAHPDHPVHEFLCDRLRIANGRSLVDLGCGEGTTLAVAARRFPGLHLVGYDLRAASLDAARRRLGSDAVLEVVDLDEHLPLGDASVDAVVSHNVLECLVDPIGLMNEAARVLVPGGSAVWSHTDFDTTVVNTADVELSRRILHGYADAAQPWMRHADARMGRKLTGLVRHSQLELVEAEAHTVVCIEAEREATDRIDNVVGALTGTDLDSSGELARWRREVDDAMAGEEFLFAESSFVVTAVRPR